MKLNGTLLVVDDNRGILSAVSLLMRNHVREVVTTTSPTELPSLLRTHMPNVVLLDMNFRSGLNNGNEGLFWLREVKRMSPQTAVVLFTAYADVAIAVEGMKAGACDFVVKPFDNAALVRSICAAFGETASDRQAESAPLMLWGDTPVMTSLHDIVQRIAPTEANILITGENGTGKDLLAREIHRLSSRAAAPLESIDMGAISESLFESELYGHVKGAFTDARADRPGKFETAHGGTLFLDEIGNLPLRLQAKLLTALQQRCVVRVGSNTPRPIDVRLICATNRDIPRMVQNGEFREDLFYRINTVCIELPPLRKRTADIPALTGIFLKKLSTAYGRPAPRVTPAALKRLASRSWPGNIRQLEHAVERAFLLNGADTLDASDFEQDYESVAIQAFGSTTEATRTLDEMERDAIAATIKDCDGNMTEVARRLGITRQTLYNKIKRYGL